MAAKLMEMFKSETYVPDFQTGPRQENDII